LSTAEQEPVAGASGLAEVTIRLAEIATRVKDEKHRHEHRVAVLEAERKDAERHRDLILAGATLEVVQIAETFLEVEGVANALVGEGRTVIGLAIQDLALGGPRLRRARAATKNYDRWRGQAIPWMSYHFGPRHGSIIFEIGLEEEYRDLGDGEPKALTPEQIDAGIAYLHALKAAV
jgi:hypothetical protein